MDCYQEAMQNVFDRFVFEYRNLDYTDEDARRLALKTMQTNLLVPKMVTAEQEKLIGEQNVQTS